MTMFQIYLAHISRVTDMHSIKIDDEDDDEDGVCPRVLRLRSEKNNLDCISARHTHKTDNPNDTWDSASFLAEECHDGLIQRMNSAVCSSLGYEILGKLLNLSLSCFPHL